MRDNLSHGDPKAARGPVASVAAASTDENTVLERAGLPGVRIRLPRLSLRVSRPGYGLAALGVLLAGCVAVVVFAAAGPSVLAPGSYYAFPGWAAGPLHSVFGRLISNPTALSYGFSALVVAM